MEKLLLTGSNGFVGSYLMSVLKDKFEITGLDYSNDKNGLPSFIKADITEKDILENEIGQQEFDYVIHCAAISHDRLDKASLFRINVDGTANLCAVFKKKQLKRFVFFSSISVYGEYGNNNLITEEEPFRPNSNYGESKYEAENRVKESGLPFFILRFPAIYTDTIKNDIQKRILLKPMGNKFLSIIPGNGNQQHTFCYIKNIPVALNVLLSKSSEIDNGCYHIADHIHVSTKDIFDFTRNKQQGIDSSKIVHFKIPKLFFQVSLRVLGIVFPSKRNSLRAIYWKLCMNNMYSTEKIYNLGFRAVSLFD
jgi:nucleoside-diphosphate-sugar epimerase